MATVTGRNLSLNLNGVVTADLLPLPLQLAGASITVEGQPSPVVAVTNASGQEQIQFQAKLEAYQRRLADFNREIQQKQREMVAEYTKKVQEAAQVVAQREGYVAVIDRGNEALIRIVIYYQRGLDVTDQVVKEFDKLNK